MKIDISFEGGKKVAATFENGLQLMTDQAIENGGDGAYPEPFACFLGSIGTCAGIYVLEFCNARKIPTEKVSLTQDIEFELDPQGKRRVSKVSMTINLPPEFPERYQKAIVKAAELCSVKKAIMHPPEFVVNYQVL
ncbi:MAG: OsmC family protein [Trichlorobacter sp.]|uniref:OsmC family protein n=1 Tax=Trichlorobacter sp. TaxID=2911007 RepID=UPI002569642C|nr:OsmC family protein [Trichlorobacter sp.]